jgi:hypothetical protein
MPCLASSGHVGLSYLAGLCASETDHAERGGSNGRGRGVQKSAAMMVDVFGHLSAPVRIKWIALSARRHFSIGWPQ